MLVDPLFSVGGCYWHDVAGGVGVEWLRGFMEQIVVLVVVLHSCTAVVSSG